MLGEPGEFNRRDYFPVDWERRACVHSEPRRAASVSQRVCAARSLTAADWTPALVSRRLQIASESLPSFRLLR